MIKKTITQIFVCLCLTYTGFGQSTQPTPSMQEQYDKLHGVKPKTPPTQSKPKPAKEAPAPKPEVAKQPKTPSNDEGGFKFKIGVRGGANYTTFSTPSVTPNSQIDPIIGYHGGLILSFRGEKFSVQPEVLYSQLGGKSNITFG
ncbi:MAG: hypothetical protein R2822_20905 [Spirosomataceae bacterium]